MNNPLFMKSTVHTSSNKLAYCGAFSRRGMTNEEKVRLVNSVYSNIKKLTIAQMIYAERGCTNERLSEALRMTPGGITRMTNEMLATGVIVEEQRSYYTVFKITKLGKKLLSFTGE